jgi:conjugal transfer pilus assembly protein TraB
MKQFLRDFPELIRKDRKTQFIAGIVLLVILFLFISPSKPRRAPRKPIEKETAFNSPDERWKDLLDRFQGDVNKLTAISNANREDIDNLKKSMQDYEATTAEIFKKILERLAEVQAMNVSQNGGAGRPRDIGDIAADDLAGSADELDTLGPESSVPDSVPPPKAPRKLAFIGPGDSVRVKLLAGVNAPTDGTPYPVVLKVISDISGPDGSALPIGEARIVAAAQGSLTDSRALLRMTKLSLRLPNGRRKEFGVDGWIVGEDGIRGMEGVLIDPIGKAIAGAGMAGGLAGLGQGIAAANTVNLNNGFQNQTFIKNDAIPEFAGGVALASAASEWQRIIEDRLQQLVPVVQVLSGREATAVFSQSLSIPDLLEQLEDEEPAVAFNSLD